MKKFLLFIIFSSIYIISIYSQTPIRGKTDNSFLSDFVHRVYTPADGLPGMTVTGVRQSHDGYIYAATYEGLARFDGVEFNVFNRDASPKYDYSSVRTLFEDSNGNLWLGHNGDGLSCIKTDGSVIKYTKNGGLSDDIVRYITEDNDGNIWIGTGYGLCILDKDGNFIEPEAADGIDLKSLRIVYLFCDSKGRVWILTENRGEVYLYSKGEVSHFDGITGFDDPTIFSVTEGKNGALYFGVSPYYVVKLEDNKETIFDVSHSGKQGTAVDFVMVDSSGHIWAATDDGVTIIHDGLFTYYDKSTGSPDNGVKDICEDSEENFWIAYNRGGLEKLSSGKFRTVPLQSSVNAICEDKDRNLIWIASDSGLFAYQNNHFVENEITDMMKGVRIRHVEKTSDGEILLSSYSETFPQVRVMPGGEVTVWTEANGFKGIKCRVSIKAKNGDYYAGTTQGLNILCHEDGSIIRLTKDDGFENEYIMWLYEDFDGSIWVGTNGAGVYLVRDRKIVRHFSVEDGLAGGVVFKINRIEGEIWISTGMGLSHYIEGNDTFVNFNSSSGFGTDSIFQIMVDETETAWMTTNKGILSANFTDMNSVLRNGESHLSVKYYANTDGLVTNGVTSVSLGTKDSETLVYFPLVDGFAIYNPKKSIGTKKLPPVKIQDYTVDMESRNFFGEEIVLPPGTKRFVLKYTDLSFIGSESIRFRYKLEGFDDDYCDWMPTRIALYTNLRHGKYRFLAMAENGDGIQSEPISVSVVKEPYIWELVWFWVAIGAALVLMVTLIIWHKIRKMRRYQIELEQKVEERTHDLKLANEKVESLLLNILPKPIADELTEHPERTIAKEYPNATVLFTDIVGFTKMSGGMEAEEVVAMLNRMISMFDERAKREGIEKIKTIGDAYMAATGLTERPSTAGALRMVRFAAGLMHDVEEFNKNSPIKIQIRCGINTGKLVAGVIGKSKFIYDIWGDTVNVASRMESTGLPMRIHVTEITHAQTAKVVKYRHIAEVEVKGKGKMKTYFL